MDEQLNAQEAVAAEEKPALKTQSYLRMEIPSQPRYAGLVRDTIYRLARENRFSMEAAFELKLICGEALANVIKHAYRDISDRPIFLEIYFYPDHAELRIRDLGEQLPVSSNLARDLGDYRERGLGLYLIGKLSDYHYFDQTGKVGTRLTIKKKAN